MKIHLLPYAYRYKRALFGKMAEILEATDYKQVFGFLYGPNPKEACALGVCYANGIDTHVMNGVHFIIEGKMVHIIELNDEYKFSFRVIADILKDAAKGETYYETNQTL